MTTDPTAIEPTDCPTTDGMPRLGLGTWENTDPDECATSVETALNMGYRHIDTAQAYGNESAVGDGIERATVDRDDIFLATKVWIDNLAPEDVKRTARESLDDLGVDTVDLLYIHWPAREYDPEATLAAFDELVDDGVTRRVGVSNFLPHQLEEAADILDAPIFAHQYEMHPFLQQQEVLDTCDELDINVVAYSPLARGHVFDEDELADIADDHGVSAAQVSLAWLRERGVTAIPKATGRDHIADNWASLDLSLSADEIARIDELDRGEREVDPGFGPWNQH
ncbi:2,5-didehydrogluconate reductase [Halovivax asiaticus JCM 14624]|uniref:2,5-didehydrogluconate reductase n=1 Tax=Halovivax asiaticus JCM 14624 TaxID=1227490 RepID=M0B9K1_9EURY|nr:aldo/keto reductase [Halovivax asiaticus]ELZ07162.1 2,5-didehydrogluconate reductase [Halovivax asiaticus JCM 14624]